MKSFTDDIWGNCSSTLVDKMITIKDKVLIRERINALSKNEMLYVFQIILKNDEKYSENNNGVFLDLSTLKFETINEIKQYIEKVFKTKIKNNIQFVIE